MKLSKIIENIIFEIRARKNYKSAPYIFIIGFNKSGTTSIHKLFRGNGVPSIHWRGGKVAKRCIKNVIDGKPVLAGYDHKYRVFSDLAFRTEKFWFEGNSLFRQMHIDYPNSYFIYNYRNMEDWILSRINHDGVVSGLSILDLHKKILGTNDVLKVADYWKTSRIRFEEDVYAYFEGNERFIAIDISDGDFVEKISNLTGLKLNPSHWRVHNSNPNIIR